MKTTKFKQLIVALFVLVASFGTAAPMAIEDPSRHPMEIAVYNTVKIVYTATYESIAGDKIVSQGIGSGVLIAPDKILTCRHLVSSYQPGVFQVHYSDGKTVSIRENAKILKADAKLDLMLLQVEPAFPDSGVKIAIRVPGLGEPVYFTGHTILPVSCLRFYLFNENSRGIMLHPVYRGDSGGGVFNTKGELIGIINVILALREAGVQFSTLIGYAVSLENIKEFLK